MIKNLPKQESEETLAMEPPAFIIASLVPTVSLRAAVEVWRDGDEGCRTVLTLLLSEARSLFS